MSRTVRRKHVRNDVILEHYCYSTYKDCYFENCRMDCPYKDKEKVLRKFRSETGVGYGWSVPKSITKWYNRKRRREDNRETSRILRQEDYYEYQYDPWIKDAGWYYW